MAFWRILDIGHSFCDGASNQNIAFSNSQDVLRCPGNFSEEIATAYRSKELEINFGDVTTENFHGTL